MKRAEIERLLPGIFQRTSVYDPKTLKGNPLYALLEVMEGLHEPDETILMLLATFFNPYQVDSKFVPYLASWVGLAPLLQSSSTDEMLPTLPMDLGRLRELIAAAAFISQWRGTAMGLIRFLETATGVQGFVVDDQVRGQDGLPIPFHILVRVPKEAEPQLSLVKRIVELEKPAYATVGVEV